MRNEETMCEGLLSVVIPVYNIRDYVERCVRSVLAQPDVPLEVLIVDDGSTDDSGAVCDALAAEDSRVTVIHKPNGRAASARNAGIRAASGGYVAFVDSDDWIAPEMAEKMLDGRERLPRPAADGAAGPGRCGHRQGAFSARGTGDDPLGRSGGKKLHLSHSLHR